MLDSALDLAARGLRVFPCHSIADDGECTCGDPHLDGKNVGKHPRIKGWPAEATIDPDRIREWWTRWPRSNPGVALGLRSGAFAVDLDPRNGGFEGWQAILDGHGKLPETLIVSTGGGGAHLFFRHPDAGEDNPTPRRWCKQIARGVDIKGDGGYVIGAGGVHKSGKRYEVDLEAPIAEAPTWLIELATKSKPAITVSGIPCKPIDHGASLPLVQEYAQQIADNHEPGVEGEKGSGPTFGVAVLLYRGLALPDDDATRAIYDRYLARCSPPWTDEGEIRHKIDDAKEVEQPIGFKLGDYKVWRWVRKLQAAAVELPTVKIDEKRHVVAEKAIAAIARHPSLYQRGQRLVEVLHVEPNQSSAGAVWRPRSTPTIHVVEIPRLDMIMSESFDMVKRSKVEEADVPTNATPEWLPKMVLTKRAHWEGVRELRAVGDAPAILPDGKIVCSQGYDPESGLYLSRDFQLNVPEAPTRGDAARAAEALLDLVGEFPFIGREHAAAWLSALLTPLARFAFEGNSPFMLFEAASAASGKTLLVELIAQIAFGESIARTPWSDDDAEIRKKISTCVSDGDRMVLFDNVANGSTLKSAALDAALTGPIWKDRRLGVNESIIGPCEIVFFGSGNNLSIGGDLERRTVYCRLESKEEDPGNRKNFKGFRYDMDAYPKQHREELLSLAMTILRSYLLAGQPAALTAGEGPMASFEGWSRLVRSAVAWCTSIDPLTTREQLRQVTDRGRSASTALVIEIHKQFGLKEFTAKDVVNAMYAPFMAKNKETNEELRDAVEELANVRPGQKATSVQVGHQLRKARGKRIDGMALALAMKGTSNFSGKWIIKID